MIRGMYASFADGDIPAVLGAMHDDIEWIEAENFIYADGSPYRGPQGVLEGVFARLGAEWDDFHATPSQILPGEATVVAIGRYTGSYKATGRSIDAQFCHVWSLDGGKVRRFQQFTDTAQVRDAVG